MEDREATHMTDILGWIQTPGVQEHMYKPEPNAPAGHASIALFPVWCRDNLNSSVSFEPDSNP